MIVGTKSFSKEYGKSNMKVIPYRFYPVMTGLAVDKNDNLWVYVQCKSRRGFDKYSPDGKHIGFFKTDITIPLHKSLMLHIYNDKLIFIVKNDDGTNRIYKSKQKVSNL